MFKSLGSAVFSAALVFVGLGGVAEASEPAAKVKRVPQIMVGFFTPLELITTGRVGNAPLDQAAAQAELNKVCESLAGDELIIKSDGETVAAGSTRVMMWPQDIKRVPNAYPEDYALGHGGWIGGCLTGANFKRVAAKPFYDIYLEGERIGTYSKGQLRRNNWRVPLRQEEVMTCLPSFLGGFDCSARN